MNPNEYSHKPHDLGVRTTVLLLQGCVCMIVKLINDVK